MEDYNMDKWDGLIQNYNNDNEFASIVKIEDIDRVKKMEKDDLQKWVNQPCTFNHVLDNTRPLAHLRNQVIGMIKVRIGEEIEKRKMEDVRAGRTVEEDDNNYSMGWLLNPSNMRVFDATSALLRRQDFVPCDKDGKRL